MNMSDAQLSRQIKLCELLGLDPTKTVHVTIEWEPHGMVTARWEGMKILTEDEIVMVGELLSDDVSRETICVECGNDLACEGYQLCSECLEKTS